MASLGLSMGGRANGSGGPGLLLASSGAEKRRILVDRQDYEAGIQSDHQAWEEEINRRYPTRANYTAPKEVRQPAVPRDVVTEDRRELSILHYQLLLLRANLITHAQHKVSA